MSAFRHVDRWTLAILAVALAARVAVVLATRGEVPQLDAADYDRIARSLAAGEGWPESVMTAAGGPAALRPPAYPLMLAAVYAVVEDPFAARLFQCLVGTLGVALLGVLGTQLFGRTTGLVAMAVAAVYPPMILNDTALMSESLFIPLMLGALAAGLAARRSEAPVRWALAAGVLIGLSVLTRQNGAVLVLAVVAAVLAAPAPRRSRLVAAGVAVAAAVLVVLPWTIRNTIEFGSVVPVATQTGVLLAGTYNDDARLDDRFPGAWRPPSRVPGYADLFGDRSLDEAELDAALREAAIEYAAEHPGYVVTATFHNVRRMLQIAGTDFERFSDSDRNVPGGLGPPARWSFYLLALLALAGAFTRRAREAPWYIWATAAIMFAAGAALAGLVRYRTAVDPFLVLLAALALVRAPSLRAAARARGG